MKFLTRFLIISAIAFFLATLITSQWFERGTFSYGIAFVPFLFLSFDSTGTILRWAFATKVADLHYQGEKVGTMKEDE